MKRIYALLLCLLMVLTMAVGCNEEKPAELTDSQIAADLAKQHGQYAYAHIGGQPTITNLQVSDKNENGYTTTLSATAVAVFSGAEVDITATMTYLLSDNQWRAYKTQVTAGAIRLTGGPDKDSVLQELENYVSLVGSVYAIWEDEYQALYDVTFADATAEMKYEESAKTATLNLSYTSDKLSFTGSYALSFGEGGWSIETVKQDDGRQHPLLRLTSLEKK